MAPEETFRAYSKAQGQSYASGRPGYSPDLFKVIVDHHVATGGKLDTVVDVGCGTGQATLSIASYFAKGIGFDASEAMIATARADAESSGSSVHFETSGAEALGSDIGQPLADDSVDLIIAATAAHWFDMELFWARAAQVVKPGGTVALFTRTAMAVNAKLTPNGEAIKAAEKELDESLLKHEKRGGKLTRDLYIDLPLPWTIENPVKGFVKESFYRKTWNKDRDGEANGAFGTRSIVTPEQLEARINTHSDVARWRAANPEKVDTEEDVVKQFRRSVDTLLHQAGVKPGEEELHGEVAIVLLMVKKA